ncbi:plasmid pRiA4b ORF-3 family protein [Propionimicrobium sp. PCR01-08-3]|uniref:plasmid pRiA4b ORF-3 family protein n=1 Tax=Propionimicrobium sp. PCR01-08-3 TaxID=3052086 RepID=UPI00255CB798|nr:plasmid pRiA4b ORF-3 family protein [Propionimicrobium sp. PCR01-08-3]WIY82934.1 plasmid pRiA4b ORF-3 family protein [Propionimicrobium sp. PCR01-08-3]
MTDDNVLPFPGARGPSGSGPLEGGLQPDPTDMLAFLASLAPDASSFDQFRSPAPKLLRKRSTRVAYVVRLGLDDVRPPVWRRLRLASDITLPRLHEVIQAVMGWYDCHLHHFVMGPDNRDLRKQPFLGLYDIEEGEQGIAETAVRLDQVLSKPGQRLFYEYDFGDSWWHTIKLEKVEPWDDDYPDAFCLTGKRACPPEDVGGVWGYMEVLDWFAGRIEGYDPEEVQQKLDWLPPNFDPDAFSADETNDVLADGPSSMFGDLSKLHPMVTDLLNKTAAPPPLDLTGIIAAVMDGMGDEGARMTPADITEAVRGYQLLIQLVGEGLALTQAGYLPPRIVQQLYTELKLDSQWIGKGNREDQTLPVLELRESATELGLIRKSRGRLTVTANGRKTADHPMELLRFISSRLPLGKPYEKDAGVLALLFMAAGDELHPSDNRAAELMEWLGWVVHSGLTAVDVMEWSRPTRDVLYALGARLAPKSHKQAIAQELLRAEE